MVVLCYTTISDMHNSGYKVYLCNNAKSRVRSYQGHEAFVRDG